MKPLGRLLRAFTAVGILLFSMAGAAAEKAPAKLPGSTGGKKLYRSTLALSLVEQPIELGSPRGMMVVSLRARPYPQLFEQTGARAGGKPVVELRLAEPLDPRREVRAGSSELSVALAADDVPAEGEPLRLAVGVSGRPITLFVRNRFGPVDLDIDIVVPPDPLEEMEIDLPKRPIRCSGALQGFEHPLRFGSSGVPAGRPRIERGVPVRCVASFTYRVTANSIARRQVRSGFTFSDENGAYAFTIEPRPVSVFLPPNVDPETLPVRLGRVEAECVVPLQCGHEARVIPAVAGVPAEEAAASYRTDIVDVLDLTVAGPAAPTIQHEGQEVLPGRILLGARLISNASTHPERNDRPFILHEPIDVLSVQHTEFLVWGLQGQPVRTTQTKPNGDIVDADPREDPCNLDKGSQLCVPGREGCNYAACGVGDIACLAYPVLQVLLEAGYDIWLVDALDGGADLLRQAGAAPLLYQQILNYGGPLGPSPPFVDGPVFAAELERRVRSGRPLEPPVIAFWPEFQLRASDLGIALPDPPPARARSGRRRAVVAGYSQGGVVARTALLLWRQKDVLPMPDVVDHAGLTVELATLGSVLLEEVGKKVPLFVSIDSPQAGSMVPVALQAYFQRIGAILAQSSLIGAAQKEQVFDALQELNGTPARQLLEPRVASAPDLGCWDLDGNGNIDGASNCTVTASGIETAALTSSDEANVFQDVTLTRLDSGAAPDGIPDGIRSIALANGSLGARAVQSGRVLDVKFDIDNWYDKHHKICDNGTSCDGGVQPGGAQWNGVCQRVGNIQVGKYISIDDLAGFGCFGDVTRYTSPVTCSLSIVIGLGLEAIGIGLRKLVFSYPMRAELEADGSTKPGTGFPTLIPTESALLATAASQPSTGWYDAYWPDESQFHTNIDEPMCRFLMFHLEGVMGGDADGYPACGPATLVSQCLAGGRRPGRVLAPGGSLGIALRQCDCNDADPGTHPGAAEFPFDGVDNDCDGRVDEIDAERDSG